MQMTFVLPSLSDIIGHNTVHKAETEHKPTKTSDIIEEFEDISVKTFNENEQVQCYGQTIWTRNGLAAIIAPPGMGKTYLLASLLRYIYKNKFVNRIFYIYNDIQDSKINAAVPADSLYQIAYPIAAAFLNRYFTKKMKVISCTAMLKSIDELKIPLETSTVDMLSMNTYYDSNIEGYIKRKQLMTVNTLRDYCEKVIKKYSEPYIIRIGQEQFNVGVITHNDFDCIVLDDLSNYPELVGSTSTNSRLYKIACTTRHAQTSIYTTCQQPMQLPKCFRELLATLCLLKGVNTNDLNKFKFGKHMCNRIAEILEQCDRYEGVVYNYNSNVLETIRRPKN